MMHHLPDELKARGIAEIDRVLKPGGHLVLADFESAQKHGQERASGQGGTTELVDRLKDMGFTDVQVDTLPFPSERHGWRAAKPFDLGGVGPTVRLCSRGWVVLV
jgi:SAM-dependent methyltransferase